MSKEQCRQEIACRFRNARNANWYLPIDATQKDIWANEAYYIRMALRLNDEDNVFLALADLLTD
jgi:hypothetical protein|nr:MAG TPA_asm: hypothetical protein [Caudoviricetes sp.]